MDGTVERTHNYPLVACPHCGREVPSNMSDMHASICAQRPEMKARTLAALTSDVPGVGVRQVVYERVCKTHGAPPITTLLRQYGGTWLAVLESFGLSMPDTASKRAPRTPEQQRMTARQREQAAIDDVAAMADNARAALAAEYDAAHALHGYCVKPAPGLYVNGRECVRIELR